MATEQQAQGQGGAFEPSELQTLLNKEFKPRSDAAKEAVETAVRTLAEQALSQTTLISADAIGTIEDGGDPLSIIEVGGELFGLASVAEEVLGVAEVLGNERAQHVGRLVGRPEREDAGAVVEGGQAGAGLERHAGHRFGDKRLGDCDRRTGEGGGHVAPAAASAHQQVVGPALVQARRVALEGRVDVDHRGQGLVRRHHEVRAVLGRVAIIGDHGRHRLPHVADAIARQDRPVRRPARLYVHGVRAHDGHPVEVGAGDHFADARGAGRARRVDRADARMGVGRAHKGDVERPGELDVVDVAAARPHEAGVLEAFQALPDVSWIHAHGLVGGTPGLR
jgi:hypothetical protein